MIQTQKDEIITGREWRVLIIFVVLKADDEIGARVFWRPLSLVAQLHA